MFVDVALTHNEAAHIDATAFGAVAVIDVLRATTTILTALENGARGVVPVATPEEALLWRQRRHDVLLGGERGAVRIPGFDLGNSPLDYSPAVVQGKLVVLTTTNGTQSFRRVQSADRDRPGGGPAVFAACLRNARAAARAAAEAARDAGRGVLLVCSGTDGRFSREDAYCAAVVLQHLESMADVARGDGADAVARLAPPDVPPMGHVAGSFHGRRLLALGLRDDVEFCAETDVSEGVPRLVSGMLVLAGTGGSNGE